MHPGTDPGEKAGAKLAERLMVEEYDHDCDGGHGSGCAPFARHAWWVVAGQPVTDPERIAEIEEQIQGGDKWHS